MKGTPSMGGKSGKKNHITCRRCGSKGYRITKAYCVACGFGKTVIALYLLAALKKKTIVIVN